MDHAANHSSPKIAWRLPITVDNSPYHQRSGTRSGNDWGHRSLYVTVTGIPSDRGLKIPRKTGASSFADSPNGRIVNAPDRWAGGSSFPRAAHRHGVHDGSKGHHDPAWPGHDVYYTS